MTVALYWRAGKLPGTTNSKENDPPPGTMQCPQHFHKGSQVHSVELNILHVHHHKIKKKHKLREVFWGETYGNMEWGNRSRDNYIPSYTCMAFSKIKDFFFTL